MNTIDIPVCYRCGVPHVPDDIKARVANGENITVRITYGQGVAANVLRWGTGALNIDGTRIPTGATLGRFNNAKPSEHNVADSHANAKPLGRLQQSAALIDNSGGARWPANTCHDGSDEVLEAFARFGERGGGFGIVGSDASGVMAAQGINKMHRGARADLGKTVGFGDTGTAARFFKSAGYSEDELLFRRAKAIMQAWNSDLANTADNSSILPRQLVVSVLSDAVTLATHGAIALSDSTGLSTSVTPSELRRISEALTAAILSIASECSPASLPIRHFPNGSLASVVVPSGPTGTTAITISRWKSDGSAADATFSITPLNSGLGAKGSASRFNYCAKASRAERAGSKHPTVKPLALMQWLCRLVTPSGGTVLDCFAGSGTTGVAAAREGFDAILIEREAEYVADIRHRLADEMPLFPDVA